MSALPPSDLVSIPEAARMAGCCDVSIRRMVRRGLIGAWGTRGRLRVSLASVLPRYPASYGPFVKQGNGAGASSRAGQTASAAADDGGPTGDALPTA